MDPPNPLPSSANPGDGQRVNVLQVTTPSAVIVATPTDQRSQSVAQIPESGALIVSQTPGSAPIIVGLIKPSDTGSISGNSAAMIGVTPNPAISSASGTPTRTIVPSMSTVTRVPSVSSSSSVSQNLSTAVVQSTQTKQQAGAHQGGGKTSKTSTLSIIESVTGTQAGQQNSQTSKTSPSKKTKLDSTTKEQGTSSSSTLHTPSVINQGKPRAFAAMMGSEASGGGGSSKKQTPTAKKGQSSKSASAKSSKSKPLPSLSSSTDPPVRSSQRNVKRPRTYDEELEELEAMAAKMSKKSKGGTSKGGSKSTTKKSNRPKSSAAVKDLGRWRPTDDLMLISAVQQTNDLAAVHLGVKFSCRFTLREIEERWYALLYDPQISKIAVEAMCSLHPGVVTMALNNALWSQVEEVVLGRIPSTDPGHLETFQKVLKENPCVFHTCRTATSLHHHWVLMGHYGLLNNQKVDLIPPGENVTSFTDAEDQLNDNELMRPRDVKEEALEQELMVADRQAKRQILELEEQLPKWRTMIDTGASPGFGSDVYAILKGKVAEFLMTSHDVIIGRGSPSSHVDFDLSLEAPAFKVSRRQATIHLTNDGEFYIRNEGRRPLYLDGKPIVSGKQAKLQHQQILEVASMSFLVLLNTKLAATLGRTAQYQQHTV